VFDPTMAVNENLIGSLLKKVGDLSVRLESMIYLKNWCLHLWLQFHRLPARAVTKKGSYIKNKALINGYLTQIITVLLCIFCCTKRDLKKTPKLVVSFTLCVFVD